MNKFFKFLSMILIFNILHTNLHAAVSTETRSIAALQNAETAERANLIISELQQLQKIAALQRAELDKLKEEEDEKLFFSNEASSFKSQKEISRIRKNMYDAIKSIVKNSPKALEAFRNYDVRVPFNQIFDPIIIKFFSIKRFKQHKDLFDIKAAEHLLVNMLMEIQNLSENDFQLLKNKAQQSAFAAKAIKAVDELQVSENAEFQALQELQNTELAALHANRTLTSETNDSDDDWILI